MSRNRSGVDSRYFVRYQTDPFVADYYNLQRYLFLSCYQFGNEQNNVNQPQNDSNQQQNDPNQQQIDPNQQQNDQFAVG
jgi:hypothetical protein